MVATTLKPVQTMIYPRDKYADRGEVLAAFAAAAADHGVKQDHGRGGRHHHADHHHRPHHQHHREINAGPGTHSHHGRALAHAGGDPREIGPGQRGHADQGGQHHQAVAL